MFHPVFIPLLITWFLVYSHPFYFTRSHFLVYGPVIENTIILPVFTVLMLKALKFIKSFYLREQKDRIIPYMATMIYYFWLYLALHKQMDPPYPAIFIAFLLGNFIAIILIFMVNIFLKVSMHTTAAGGMLGVILLMLGDPYVNITLPLMIVLLIAGLIATSRMILSAHNNMEIYSGFLIGIFSQLIAMLII